jgi:hypothetical protein
MPLKPNPNPVVENFGICVGCKTQIEPHEVIGSICRCGENDSDDYERLAAEAEDASYLQKIHSSD